MTTNRRDSLKAPFVAGSVIALAFFGGFGAFATLAPLAGAAVAPGVVSPDTRRTPVQHLEGGIVRTLHVGDGDPVAAGELLIELDDTAARAEHQALLAQWRDLAVRDARLTAEQTGAAEIRFPTAIETARAEPSVSKVIAAEQHRFVTRRTTLAGHTAILQQRIAQLNEEIGGHEEQIVSQATQLELIEQELEGVEQLFAKGLERQGRVLALKRGVAHIEGMRAEKTAAIARAQQAIGEARLEITQQQSQRQDEVATELAEVRGQLFTLDERLRASADKLARTRITAPVAGRVIELQVTSASAVIGSGAPILQIVAVDEPLLIDARVAPADIDVVRPGQMVQVHLTAYSQRNLQRIEGKLREVSADRLVDPDSGQPYFGARIEVTRDSLAALGADIELMPGMPAEVMILTGERTLLDYLLEPVMAVLRRGMREV